MKGIYFKDFNEPPGKLGRLDQFLIWGEIEILKEFSAKNSRKVLNRN